MAKILLNGEDRRAYAAPRDSPEAGGAWHHAGWWWGESFGRSGLSFCGQDHKELMTALCPFCVVRLALSDKFHDLRMVCFLRVTQELFVQVRPLQSMVLDADKVKDDIFGDVVSIGHAVSYTRRGVDRNSAPSVALRIVSPVCVSSDG